MYPNINLLPITQYYKKYNVTFNNIPYKLVWYNNNTIYNTLENQNELIELFNLIFLIEYFGFKINKIYIINSDQKEFDIDKFDLNEVKFNYLTSICLQITDIRNVKELLNIPDQNINYIKHDEQNRKFIWLKQFYYQPIDYKDETIYEILKDENDIKYVMSAIIMMRSLKYKVNKLILNNNEIFDLTNWNDDNLKLQVWNILNHNPIDYSGYHSGVIRNLPDELLIQYQIFLHNPKFLQKCYDDNDETIYSYKKFYVHLAYCVNICKRENKLGPHIESMKAALKFGASGTVLHPGKKTTLDYETATNNMILNIAELYQYTTKETPLLIETLTGKVEQVAVSYESFIDFYIKVLAYTGDDGSRIKICIDTCHIFANGYDVYDYVKSIPLQFLGLIHLNNSKDPFNSRLDHHSLIDNGHIDLNRLKLVADYCRINGIDMVKEEKDN